LIRQTPASTAKKVEKSVFSSLSVFSSALTVIKAVLKTPVLFETSS